MKEIVTLIDLYHEYRRIMKEEAKINPACEFYACHEADPVYMMAKHIQEVTKASFVGRSYNVRYKLADCNQVFESVAAHTNLVIALIDGAMSINNQMKNKIKNSYSYREILEVARIHDLPENRIGDWPDNGSRDDAMKAMLEDEYLKEYLLYYPADTPEFKQHVLQLFNEMNNQSTPSGRLIYMADKTSAIIATLTLDLIQRSPMMHINNKDASERDKTEMNICDHCSVKGYRKASEMWTIDHFRLRKLNRFDDTGFFTAILVMYTLLINGRWYHWRELDYEQ
jgi:5'-deoxynucleotidase YfbR-like HD superfamily hydrolase